MFSILKPNPLPREIPIPMEKVTSTKVRRWRRQVSMESWESGTGLGSAAQRVLVLMGLERQLGAGDSQKTKIPGICQWASMVSSSGGTSSPAVGLLECLRKDKWNVHPGRSKGPLPQDLNSMGIWGWAQKFRSGSILAIPMGCRKTKRNLNIRIKLCLSFSPDFLRELGLFYMEFSHLDWLQVLQIASRGFVYHGIVGLGWFPVFWQLSFLVELLVPSFFL